MNFSIFSRTDLWATLNQIWETFTSGMNITQSCRNGNPRVAPLQEDTRHAHYQAPMHLVGLLQLELPQFFNRRVGVSANRRQNQSTRQVMNERQVQEQGNGTADDPQATTENIEPRNGQHSSGQRGNYTNWWMIQEPNTIGASLSLPIKYFFRSWVQSCV